MFIPGSASIPGYIFFSSLCIEQTAYSTLATFLSGVSHRVLKVSAESELIFPAVSWLLDERIPKTCAFHPNTLLEGSWRDGWSVLAIRRLKYPNLTPD